MRRIRCQKIAIWLLTLLLTATSAFAQERQEVTVYTVEDSIRTTKQLKIQLEADGRNAELWNSLGLELLYQLEFEEAAKAFENAVANDPSNTDYVFSLQFAFLKSSEPAKRRKAAAKALRKNPSDSRAYFELAVAGFNEGNWEAALSDVEASLLHDPGFSAAFALKSEVLLRQYARFRVLPPAAESITLLKRSIGVLEECLKVCESDKNKLEIAIKERSMMAAYFEGLLSKGAGSEGGPRKVRTSGPPGYTRAAERLRTNGSVRLALMFNSDGTVGPILVIDGLPAGMTEKAINAAKNVTFEPARINGEPVNVVKTISFNFSLN